MANKVIGDTLTVSLPQTPSALQQLRPDKLLGATQIHLPSSLCRRSVSFAAANAQKCAQNVSKSLQEQLSRETKEKGDSHN